MPTPTTILRRGLLIGAGLMSLVLSPLSIVIYLFGCDLRQPCLEGILACFGPALSLPAFLTVFWSRSWHRRISWLLACATYVGIGFGTLKVQSSGHLQLREVASVAFACGRQPLVICSVVIAVMVECSYQFHMRRVDQASDLRSGIASTMSGPQL